MAIDPFTLSAIASIAGPVVGGIMGQQEGARSRADAQRLRRQALAEFAGIEVPDIANLTPEELEYLGDFDPRLEQALELEQTAMEQVAADPRLQAQQMAALEQIAGMTGTGLTDAEEAGLMRARRQAAAEAQAQQGQILQNMQQRGQGGSGAELIARLQAAQSAADRGGAAGLDMVQAAQQRALSAMSQQGNLAGSIRSQDVSEQQRLAAARDAVNRFNVSNQQSVQQRNVGAQNQAGLRNLSTQQQIANQNVGQRNQAQIYNRNLEQQKFDNQRSLAANKAGIRGGMAGAADTYGAQSAAGYAQIGAGVGQGAAAIMDYFGNKDKEE